LPRANPPGTSARSRLLQAGWRRAAGARRWLALAARRRHSRAAGALVGLSLVLGIVSLGGPAPGDAGSDDRIETRLLAPAGAAASVEVSAPPTVAGEPLTVADASAEVALERRAADAIAEGRFADAARLHARLAELHPERPVHRAAARILGESARELATDAGDVVWAGRASEVR
jgi:hypothetical protein